MENLHRTSKNNRKPNIQKSIKLTHPITKNVPIIHVNMITTNTIFLFHIIYTIYTMEYININNNSSYTANYTISDSDYSRFVYFGLFIFLSILLRMISGLALFLLLLTKLMILYPIFCRFVIGLSLNRNL